MAIVTLGIDLAKNVFALHGVDEAGAARLKQPKVARGKLNARADLCLRRSRRARST